MSFMRTLVTLAAGYATAKGIDQYKKMGGMAGLQQAMGGQGNPFEAMTGQMGDLMQKFGMPAGSADGLQKMLAGFGGGQSAAATAGLGGLMSAFSGAAATGAENMTGMFDAMTGGTQATDAMEENAKLMIRAMIQAAKADGSIDDAERAKIVELLGDVSPEERAFVEAELAKPIDVAGLAHDTAEAMRAQVYAVSAMAIDVDTLKEARYLDQLSAALQLNRDMVAQVHKSMGLPT